MAGRWMRRSFFGAGAAASTPVKSNKRKAPASEDEDATPVKTPDAKKQATKEPVTKKPTTKAVAKVVAKAAESPREKRSRKAVEEEEEEVVDESMEEDQAEKEQEPASRDASDDEDECMAPATPSPVKTKTKRAWIFARCLAMHFDLTYRVGLLQPGVVAFDSAWWTTRTTATPTCHSQASIEAARAWGRPPAATPSTSRLLPR